MGTNPYLCICNNTKNCITMKKNLIPDLAEEKPQLLRRMMMRLERLKRETGKITDY